MSCTPCVTSSLPGLQIWAGLHASKVWVLGSRETFIPDVLGSSRPFSKAWHVFFQDPLSSCTSTKSPLLGQPQLATCLQQQTQLGPGGAAAHHPHRLYCGHSGPPHGHPGGLGSERHVRIHVMDTLLPGHRRTRASWNVGPVVETYWYKGGNRP